MRINAHAEPRVPMRDPPVTEVPTPALEGFRQFYRENVTRDEHNRRIKSVTPELMQVLSRMRRPRLIPQKYTFLDAFVPHNEHRLQWQQERLHELQEAHGEVSSAVAALIGAAGWHHAAAEYANEQAAITGNMDHFALATRFSNAARGNVLSAWDLCQREAETRRRNNPNAGHTMGELLTQLDPLTPLNNEPPPKEEPEAVPPEDRDDDHADLGPDLTPAPEDEWPKPV